MGSGLFTPTHLIFLFLLALLLFGAKRLPEIGRSLGVGMREFKDSVTGDNKPEETRSELPPPNPVAPPAQPPAAPPAQETAPAATPESQRETEPVS
jgi:sec-independent protein translocase protein TatA